MKHIIIVDVDGTLSIVGERVKHLKENPPSWKAFYERCGEDKPVVEIIRMLVTLSQCYQIVLCTGRTESSRSTTEQWFAENEFVEYSTMLMRPDGDHRHDTELKPELLEKSGINLDDIAFVLEDRNSMVAKWRELGLICLQVAEGNF